MLNTRSPAENRRERGPVRAAVDRQEMSPTKRCANSSDGYRTWLNALPQNREASAAAEALRAICDLDLSYIEIVEPPRSLV
jgi:riboflavin biosynthesis pyrimidine reductase